jgi:hypothetical protein
MNENLQLLAVAMGFEGVTAGFVATMQGKVGAFTRFAAKHSLPLAVGVAAKREFIALLQSEVSP